MTQFYICLKPQRRDDKLTLEKRGNTLALNGQEFDPETYNQDDRNQWIVGEPEPFEDGWKVTIILPHGSPAPRSTRFPEPITVSLDGLIQLPAYEGPDEDAAELELNVAKFLGDREQRQTMLSGNAIHIPPRLMLGNFPEGVYFSEVASPFATYPDYGAVVADVIGTASLLELEMLRTAVSQHGKDALTSVKTTYAVLKEDKYKRRNYIKRLADSTGRALVWETINWAYKFSEPVFKIRNQFAHNIWGKCPSIPNALLLADPIDRISGQAALSQLLAHQPEDKEAQKLLQILLGEGGSELSEEDAKLIWEIIGSRQNSAARLEAFEQVWSNPFDLRAPAAEVWTENDFRNAALAANMARRHVLGQLQQIAQWLNGLRAEDELEPLPEAPARGQRH